ncbi:MAG: MBL fold metallo-hydrolase [Planctomycetes bacterium]|nr:MBL fold metallo-hydrolase [Planctomycetota bacterium]
MPNLAILDVGAGNCAVIIGSKNVVVVDCGLGGTLAEFLLSQGIKSVDLVIVSHADEDHLAGLQPILLDQNVNVAEIAVNSNHLKSTDAWNDLRHVAANRKQRKGGFPAFILDLSRERFGRRDYGDFGVEVLAPSQADLMAGVGGKPLDAEGKPINRTFTSNSLSVVVRVEATKDAAVLLTGDLDETGLRCIERDNSRLAATTIVFPHHGGLPAGASSADFTKRLLDRVRPKRVLFSIGRGKHDTPRQEIVEEVRKNSAIEYIGCTQLSENCSKSIPGLSSMGHLSRLPASGKSRGHCCAGTIRINLGSAELQHDPLDKAHQDSVKKHIPGALCMKDTASSPPSMAKRT